MLLIVARADDTEAHRLAAQWSAEEATVLTCADLSQPGWCLRPENPAAGTLALRGECIPVERVRGVITRLPAVACDELLDVHADDREYVAAEMHAFLVAWLSRLHCPVINRPTPRCLTGPSWPAEAWLSLAARLGMPVRPRRRLVELGAKPDSPVDSVEHVVVVGERTFPQMPPGLRELTLRLAHAARTHLLSVGFDADWQLVEANPRPALDTREVVDALRRELLLETMAR